LNVNRAPIAAASSLWQRLSPWAGIAFAILFVVGIVTVLFNSPDYDDPQAWLEYHDETGNRWGQVVGAYLAIIGAFAQLWFATAMVGRLGGSRGGGDVLTGLARSASALFVAFVTIGALCIASISGAVEFGGADVPGSADFGIQFEQLGVAILLLGGGLSAAAVIATISELAREAGSWPRWLVWFGFICAVALLFTPAFVPLVAAPLWGLVTGITLLARARSLTLPEPTAAIT
jgi:hypothetical protein